LILKKFLHSKLISTIKTVNSISRKKINNCTKGAFSNVDNFLFIITYIYDFDIYNRTCTCYRICLDRKNQEVFRNNWTEGYLFWILKVHLISIVQSILIIGFLMFRHSESTHWNTKTSMQNSVLKIVTKNKFSYYNVSFHQPSNYKTFRRIFRRPAQSTWQR